MFMVTNLCGFGASGDGTVRLPATDFDGSATYLTRGAALTGASDSSQGIMSFWHRIDAGNGTFRKFLENNESSFCFLNSTNKFLFNLFNSSGTISFSFETGNAYTASATWRHVLASWNTNFSSGNKVYHLYINDVSDAALVSDSGAAFNVDYTSLEWYIGSNSAPPAQVVNGCLAEYYFAPGQFLDFSVEANRRKFISALGKPVSLGGDGSLPTGVAPIIYLHAAPAGATWPNNGTGGNFITHGTFLACSTTPE